MAAWDDIPEHLKVLIIGLAFPLHAPSSHVLNSKLTCTEFCDMIDDLLETQMEWRRMAHQEDYAYGVLAYDSEYDD